MLRRSAARPALRVAVALMSICAVPAAAFAGPAPVGLGTAADFAVLAGSGMTNTGTSTIAGDVGSSPTHGQTGFGSCPAADCVDLTGTNHDAADPNDAVTQQAKSDLVTAYDDAFGRTGGTPVTAPLGDGTTLVPGVYTSAADLFVGGDLTLDGGGDAGAVFIFQARTGTLTTAAGQTSGISNTRVLLANGAQACNVFWQVGSSATISTFTQFAGTVMALQSITVNTRATLEAGRVLARNGAVTLDTNTIRRPACAAPAATATATPTPTPTPATDVPSQQPEPQPLSITPPPTEAVPMAGARIAGPSRPVHGPFRITVTGSEIQSVTFYLDGRRLRLVRARPGQRRFVLRLDPRRQSLRVHRVTARVRYTQASGGGSTTRRVVFRRAVAGPPSPRFTG